jgi:2-(1,2-epoxy-1,2-dihydrophenyl)acetyl-CoA isomerase
MGPVTSPSETPTDLDTVSCQREGDVVVVEFNRPERHNAMNEQMALEFSQALRWVRDSEVRAVVVGGRGRSFSAGRDISGINPASDDAADVLERLVNPVVRAVRDLPMPVFAAVQGVCVGAGLGIALACDVIYASDDARLGSPFATLGAVLDSGAHAAMLQRLGPGRTLELVYSGRLLDGRTAVGAGLIEHSVPRPLLRETVLGVAAQVAAGPTESFRESKAIVRQLSAGIAFDHGLQLELEAQVRSSHTDDYREGFTAYLEKRNPRFTGR